VLAPVAGRIADRVDSRVILVAAGLAQAVVCSALALVHRPAVIIALVALLACGLAVTQPTLAALLPAMVRREDLAKAAGINQTAGTIGMLAAPAIAGVLVGRFGTELPLLIDAGTYLALVGAGLLLRTRRNVGASPSTAAQEPVDWRLRGDRLVATMVAAGRSRRRRGGDQRRRGLLHPRHAGCLDDRLRPGQQRTDGWLPDRCAGVRAARSRVDTWS
jgi:MFS family permease